MKTTKTAPIATGLPEGTVRRLDRSTSTNGSSSPSATLYSYMTSPFQHLFGYSPSKTKRTISEEAESGNEVSVGTWIKEGSNPNEVDAYGYTPLINAAAMGRLSAVNNLIKHGADVNRVGPFGFTALHAASQNGHREVVATLLKNNAVIDAQNQDKDTPMHLALRSHHIEIVYMLVRIGANPRISGLNEKDCVQCAEELGLKDLAYTLKNYNPLVGQHPHSAPIITRNLLLAN